MPEDISSHKLKLARDLVEDIELSRLLPEQLLLKASRLARLVNATEISIWLRFELRGYLGDDPISLKYMSITNRWTDRSKNLGYWIPLAEIDGHIAAKESQLQRLRIPDVNFSPSSANPTETVTGTYGINVTQAMQPVRAISSQMETLATAIATLHGIRSRVLSVLHEFVISTYYQLEFSGMSETIFTKYKATVDEKLIGIAAEVLDKIPAIYERLSAGDKEAISHALDTCRRIIQAFADANYPPQKGTIAIDEEKLNVNSQNYLNRIEAFVATNCKSASRRRRLRKTLREIHERVCAGVHSDVSLDEAKALFVQTYLILGEIALLAQENPTMKTPARKENSSTNSASSEKGD